MFSDLVVKFSYPLIGCCGFVGLLSSAVKRQHPPRPRKLLHQSHNTSLMIIRVYEMENDSAQTDKIQNVAVMIHVRFKVTICLKRQI